MKRQMHIHRLFLFSALALVILWGYWGSEPTRAQSDIISVTESADDAGTANVSLREALTLYETGDVIRIDVAAVSLQDDVDITSNVVIDLNGNEIEATGTSPTHRVFNVTSSGTLSVSNGTLTGSSGAGEFSGNGGVIYTEGALFVSNATIQGGDVSGNGGGIYATGSSAGVSLSGVTVTSNSAEAGGGIYGASGSVIDINASTISNNTLDGTLTSRFGAGIASLNSLTVEDSRISSNSDAFAGGGIYSSGATLAVGGTTINGNAATPSGTASNQYPAGGGIYLTGGSTAAFVGLSAIYDNDAYRGGGIYAASTLDLYNSTVDNNETLNDGAKADEAGGGIFVSSGTLIASFVTISDNTAPDTSESGVVLAGGNAIFKNSILENSANGNCSTSSGSFTDDSGNVDSGSSCGFGGGSLSSTDPLLLSRASSGTRPLDEGTPSPAIDFVSSCRVADSARTSAAVSIGLGIQYSPSADISEDQRRAPRDPANNNCDAGAYEATSGDTAGIVVTNLESPLTVNEDGVDFTAIQVSLASQPDNDDAPGNPDAAQVVLELTPDEEIEIEAGGSRVTNGTPLTLTFDVDNWATPQIVRIYGFQDTDDTETDPHPGFISYSVDTAATTDNDYDSLASPGNTQVLVSDDDDVRTVEVSSNSGSEGAGTLNFTLTLEENGQPLVAPEEVIVNISITDVGAIEDSDYEYSGAFQFTFTEGVVVQNIPITLIDDDIVEPTETFLIQITSVTGARIGSNSVGTGTISDNDDFDSDEELELLPEDEDLPTGQIDEEYEQSFSATGGASPYSFVIDDLDDFIGDDWEFEDGVLRGTPTEQFSVTFRVTVQDASGETEERTYFVEFTVDGEPSASAADATPTPSPTLTAAEVAEVRQNDQRATLGPPQVQIDPDLEIPRAYIYSGPADGATIINIAQAGRLYDAIGFYQLPGSTETWYLIEYPVRRTTAGQEDGAETESVENEQGWVSDTLFRVSGYIPDIPRLANPFDGASLSSTGVTGRTPFKNNIYQYPTPDSAILLQFEEGNTFQVLGRTRIDGRDISNWLLIRLDRSGQIGWMKYTPYIEINGDASRIPQY